MHIHRWLARPFVLRALDASRLPPWAPAGACTAKKLRNSGTGLDRLQENEPWTESLGPAPVPCDHAFNYCPSPPSFVSSVDFLSIWPCFFSFLLVTPSTSLDTRSLLS